MSNEDMGNMNEDMGNMYCHCPVCSSDGMICSEGSYFCPTCKWNAKALYIGDKTVIDGIKRYSNNIINEISEYLMVNECNMTLKELMTRFSSISEFDIILEAMKARGLIMSVKSADGKYHIIQLMMPKQSCCDWVDITMSFSNDEDPSNLMHYRVPCLFDGERVEEFRKSVENFVSDLAKKYS